MAIESDERMKVPASCADCGNDAYIRLTRRKGEEHMVCAHCFAERIRSGALERHQPVRVERDVRLEG